MKKGKLFGWEKVFGFTLKQVLKSKGNIIMMIILLLITLGAYPIMSMTLSKDFAKTQTSIKKLIISDKTSLELQSWFDITALEHEGIVLPETIEYTDKTVIADKNTEKNDSSIDLKEDTYKDSAAVIISFDEKTYQFSFTGIYSAKGDVSKSDVTDICNLLSENFTMSLAEYKGISTDQLKYLNAEVISDTVVYEPEKTGEDAEADKPKEAKLSSGEYGIVIMVLCITIFLVSLSGEQVASAVLQEKASKLVEFLLTSVQPLALLVGKVAAIFVMTLLDVLMMILGLLGSTYISQALFPNNSMGIADTFEKVMSATGDAKGIEIQYFMIPVAILIILCGVLFYAVLAALAGACVSRMEELTEGMKLFTATLIIGSYFGMFVCMTDMISEAPSAIRMVAQYLPLSATSFTPSYLVLGKLTAVEGLISLTIMIASTAFMFIFAAKVYETLIYHKGTPLKIKDLIGIAKKGGEK